MPAPDATGTTTADAGSDNAPTVTVTATAPVPVAARPRRRKARYVVVAVVLAGAFTTLVVKGLAGSLNYFETVNQAEAQRATLGSQTFRMEGLVVPGTVHATNGGVDFTVEGGGVCQPVIETGQPPQLFQPDVPVVVVGHFAGTGFYSDQIIVDHGSAYVAQHPNRVRAPDGRVCVNGRCTATTPTRHH